MTATMIHELPHDIWVRAEALAATGDYPSELDAIRTGLSILEHRRADLAAIEEGLADLKAGRFKSREQFEADFRKRHNIPLED